MRTISPYIENWTDPSEGKWTLPSVPDFLTYPEKLPLESGKQWLRFKQANSVMGGTYMMGPSWVMPHDADWTLTIESRFSSRGPGEFNAAIMYAGESRYFGLYQGENKIWAYDLCYNTLGDSNNDVYADPVAFAASNVYTYKYVYTHADHTAKVYLKVNGGAYSEAPLAISTGLWYGPITIWIAGVRNTTNWTADIGTITFTLDSVVAAQTLSGAFDSLPWSHDTDDSIFGPTEWSIPTMSTGNYPWIIGSHENDTQPGGMGVVDDSDTETSYSFLNGSWTKISPPIAGDQFSLLRLWGRQFEGFVKIRVLDAAQQPIPGSAETANGSGYILGNDAWFFPNGNKETPLSIDLSNVLTGIIYLEASYLYNGSSAYYGDPGGSHVYPSLWQGYQVLGTASTAISVIVGSAQGAGTGIASVAQSTRYSAAVVGSAGAVGFGIASIANTGIVAVVGTANAYGLAAPSTVEFTRYIAAEAASANASGRASPIVATVTDAALELFITLKGSGNASFPMYIKGGSKAGLRLQ